MLDLAIINGTVITMDGDRRVLHTGAVGVRDGRITDIEEDVAALDTAREIIDGSGTIVPLPSIPTGMTATA